MRTSFPRSLSLVLVAALALPIAGCAPHPPNGHLPNLAREHGTK